MFEDRADVAEADEDGGGKKIIIKIIIVICTKYIV